MWIVACFLAAAILWTTFRIQWWRRVHYHTLLGRTYPPDDVKGFLNAALVETDRVLREQSIPYWLDAGTLLGAYRSQKFIPWDDDLDICIMHDDHERLWELRHLFQPPYRLVKISRWWSIDKVIPFLERVWPCETFLRLLDTRTQLYVDIFEGHQRPDGWIELLPLSNFHRPRDVHRKIYAVPGEWIFPLGTILFEEREYPAPCQVEPYLHAYYGTDLTPDHEWDATRGKYVRRRVPLPSAV